MPRRAPSAMATGRSMQHSMARVSLSSPPIHSRKPSAIHRLQSMTSSCFTSSSARRCPDISLNAVANLGYAECRFLKPVFAGDTLSAASEIIGLKENSNGKTGTVTVRTRGDNQHGEAVLSYVRWVMVRKRDDASVAPPAVAPQLQKSLAAGDLGSALPSLDMSRWDDVLSRFILANLAIMRSAKGSIIATA